MPQCPNAPILYQVCSQKWTATADVLYNVQAHEAEKRRLKEINQTAFDLRQTRGGDFPALPPAGDAVAPRSAAGGGGASWGSGMKVPAARKHVSASLGGGGRGGGAAAASTAPGAGRSAGEGGRPERAASAGARGNAAGGAGVADAASMKLAARWVQARRDRDYATADEIRTQLRALKLDPEVLALQL